MEATEFQALFEHSSMGIIISNQEGIIEKCNPFACKLFGYQDSQLEGKAIEILVPKVLRERHIRYRENYNKKPTSRAMGGTLTVQGFKKDDSKFPVEISLTFYKDKDKNTKIVSFVSDITERKKAEDALAKLTGELEDKVNNRTKELSDALVELNNSHQIIEKEVEKRKQVEKDIRESLEREKELSELKSRFVSMASHEFRTPLAGILSSASLLDKYNEIGDSEKHKKHIVKIKKSVKHLTNILNEFLSMDKLDQGKLAINISEFSILELVKDLNESMEEIFKKDQTLIVTNNSNDFLVKLDREILHNSLVNLLSNAVKYSAENANIYLIIHENKDNFSISIKDEGIGIPKEDQKHLFERFFRAHNVTTIKGTGLGLNIVKSYLKLLDGVISFESEEGVGTVFTIQLQKELKE